MPRPSLKAQRRAQIISAAMSCVAKYGMSGLTLDKVAETAEIARPLIRHNVGNREQLVEAVTQQFIESSNQKMDELQEHLPDETPLTTAVDYLFDIKSTDTTLMLVAEALIAESANDKTIEKMMQRWLVDFVKSLQKLAKKEFPTMTEKKCLIVATGITGIYFTVDSMTPISGLSEFAGVSKKAALLLLEQLR